MTKPISRVCTAALIVFSAAALFGAPLNLTGTWQPKNWTLKIGLKQDGDRVWGHSPGRDFWFRGHWEGNRLVVIANNFEEKRKGACKPRGVFTLGGKTVSVLDSVWWQTDTGRTLKGPWARLSADPGEVAEYPYATELTYCGSLRTYELTFASGADTLLGSDWPILGAVAEVLKSNPSFKIEVAGHTDSTGDPKKNQELSERRAAAVKQALVDLYGADASRIAAKGWGPDQPIVENTSVDGKAMNRRVEIVLAR